MTMKQVMEVIDLLDDPNVNGEKVETHLKKYGVNNVEITPLEGANGKTDFMRILLPGRKGKSNGGVAPTLGIAGRLGGVGARPEVTGIVSDADGAIVALSSAATIGNAQEKGDIFEGDVIITTHIAPNAPTRPHEPTPFMDSPVDIMEVLKYEVDPKMDALLSIDSTKANRVIKVPGFAITPTVKDGWILKVHDDLIDVYQRVTGKRAAVAPITMQDITPYGNDIYHINSIMQPWVMTNAPVVGVATTANVPVPGCGTGANYVFGLEQATRFCIEVAKAFTSGQLKFYDKKEFQRLVDLYGNMGESLRKGIEEF
ncbi:MAG: DUF1177 domain-containing protein [Candidatus Korarchaeota archaeon]|nr:DUF1177 domain-containing protein [Candidatus Korarchaeota archaeon]NIU82096.1 DUF1177 family protein [Candidatus Thorarchaeota archaeon]NIW12507.1 DUF1177 family protein [Candidatus Thorarchaeota archaeon]NIW50726.1 DUF1177 family protein [Candidatus Korarchaeota archaeon]